MQPKPLFWVGRSLKDIRALPDDARRELGFDLRSVQEGLTPRDWKPMRSIGVGVVEIRVRAGGAFRLMYIATFPEGVYVLHVFQKQDRKTSSLDLEAAKVRLAYVRRSLGEG